MESVAQKIVHTRVRSGIRLAADGTFWHDGEAVRHPAIAAAWHRGLERAPDGRYLIRFGHDWAFVTVEDAPFVVRRAVTTPTHISLLLSNGKEEPLDPTSLALSDQGILYCRVMGDHRARFSRQAQADIGAHLQPGERDGYVLHFGGRWPIGSDVGHPPPRPEDGPAPEDDAPVFRS